MGYIGNEPAEAYSSISKQTITGNGGTSYTLDFAVGTAAEVSVFVNNVRQEPGVAYTVAGTALTMTGAVSSTDDFYVIFQGKAQQTVDVEISKDDSPQLGGNLDVNGNAITGSTVAINGSTGEFMITATENGPVALRYDNNLKLTTKSDGVDITGELQADSLDIDGDGDITGNLTLGGNLNLGDNDKAIFGAGSDLQVFHDATDSHVVTTNGDLNLQVAGAGTINLGDQFGNTLLKVVDNADVKLYHGSSPALKLATTATGVDVTGTVTASGNVTSKGGQVRINDGTTSLAGGMFTHKEITGGGTSNDTVIFAETGNKIRFATNGSVSDKVVIDTAGNVGIGTSSPIEKITANGAVVSTASNSTGSTSGANRAILDFTSGGARIGHFRGTTAAGSGYASFYTESTERMRIESNGDVNIGATSGQGRLEIVGKGSGDWGQRFITDITGSTYYFVNFCLNNGSATQVGYISSNGSSTNYATSSDYRLKENVVADWDATTRLKQLNPVRFNFIADPDTTVDGFLAHEVQSVVPEATTGTHNGMRDEEYQVSAATGDIYTPATDDVAEVIHSTDVERPEELAEGQQWRETTAAVMGTRSVPDYQGIDQSKLVPLLVKTIQELEARITALEAS